MLKLSNVHKSFNGTVAVDDCTITIQSGEVFGLLGPNGAGKTTTVNLAIGLLKPDQGSVYIGEDGSPAQPNIRKKIGVAPQALSLYEELTGTENLIFFGKLQGLSGKHLHERVEWALDFVSLKTRGKDLVKEYSGGMKRRLNLAIAIVHDPPLLLLDEPTVGVDPQSRNAIFDNILALRAEGRSILFTTHYMEEAQRLCDRVGIMDQGKMLALDSVDNLIKAHGGKDLVIAETATEELKIETDDPIAELERLKKNTDLHRFRVERPNLESVFLNLTGRQLRD
ncbi:ABC transporter ATP-binding protein [candidate division LCP-89 bacterium B3_LCP]|uniref:ABC transporter ATP-binding protein n=1 Tax=candidate division LCP-89 bacterium B3_LCP TaxID=2012998 RepID=A0A532V0L8_UNCL8|nr:MAG: ABC transporter ATP-binding protein [candidate division LCP-89 bacterium B3_LCP]